MITDGNGACSKVAYLFSEICSIYPITPSSPMASNVDDLSHSEKNIFNTTARRMNPIARYFVILASMPSMERLLFLPQ